MKLHPVCELARVHGKADRHQREPANDPQRLDTSGQSLRPRLSVATLGKTALRFPVQLIE
jgi:hypothetical protein